MRIAGSGRVGFRVARGGIQGARTCMGAAQADSWETP